VGEVFVVLREIIATNGPCRIADLRQQAVARGVSATAVKWTVSNGFRLGLLVEARTSHIATKRGRLIDTAKPFDTNCTEGLRGQFDLSRLWASPVSFDGGIQ
jgi:hypothetical protein